MKILLFGEYSGLFNNLKDGLLILGHDVFLASNGDSFKDYPSDYRFDMHIKGRIGNAVSMFNIFTNLKKFTGNDIVFVISTNPLFKRSISDKLFDFLIANNGKVFLSGAGLSTWSFNFWYNNMNSKYYHYVKGDFDYMKNKKFKYPYYITKKRLQDEQILLEKLNGYIPIMYEYAEPYRNVPNILKTLPIPINLSKFEYQPNQLKNNKIVFFHGITRPCKGGEFIIKAFEELSKKYPSNIEFIVKGGLPFKDYIELLQRTNVVLDDVNAYSLGMNALFSMAQGKIVMGGAESVASEELGYTFCPAINLIRDVGQIKDSIENVIENKNKIEELGYESRRFVETYHDYIKVAQAYLDLWKQN
jgi:glycosyltransferase involved in cell wall biosynthesis